MARGTRDATILLIDVGRSMSQPMAPGIRLTRGDVALGVSRSFVQQKLLFAPKEEVGIVLFGAATTSNELQADGYENVFVARGGLMDAPDIETLRFLEKAKAEAQESDAVNGLIVAIDLLIKRTEGKKYSRSIHLFTEAGSAVAGDEDLLSCGAQLESTHTKLKVTLVGSTPGADGDLGAWSSFAKGCSQVELVSLAAAARSCGLFARVPEQRAKVRVNLQVSDDLSIPVGVFSRTQAAKLPTLKKRSKLAAALPPEHQRTDKVIMERTYHLEDDPDGEEVKKEDRIRGHKYGKSIVPMSEFDEAALMYTCERELICLGFAFQGAVLPQHSTHQVETVAAQDLQGDGFAVCAFESLVHAMAAEGRVMICRYSFRKNAPPKLIALTPSESLREPGRAATLEMQRLPFTEDIREWPFASVPVPSQDQRDAIASLVDALDLSSSSHLQGTRQTLQPGCVHNPSLRRFYDFMTKRAVDLKASVPGVAPEHFVELDGPPARSLERINTAKAAERLKEAFVLQKIEKATGKKRRFWRAAIVEKQKWVALGEVDTKRIKVDPFCKDEVKDEKKVKEEEREPRGIFGHGSASASSATPVMAGAVPRVHVGSVHPERDFLQWLARRQGGVDTVGPAIQQMCAVIERFAEEGEDFHGKALGCLATLRSGCVREGEAQSYNDFVRSLRVAVGIRRSKFWASAAERELGLVTDTEVPMSTVTVAEAKAFLRGEVLAATPSSAPCTDAAAPLCERDLEAMLE